MSCKVVCHVRIGDYATSEWAIMPRQNGRLRHVRMGDCATSEWAYLYYIYKLVNV